MATSGVTLGAKRIELLRETIPTLSRVAVLRHPANPVPAFAWQTTEPAALVINLKTAKALGLTIPPSLLLRADQVLE